MNKILLKHWLPTAFLLFMKVVTILAQSLTTPSPVFLNFAAPNAAAFNKFIDNPIGLYNGIPDVNIPIYTLKDGMIEIPINLRYNTSGIKVDEEASWIGLGWNLNVAGMINQSVVGKPDDDMSENYYRNIISPNNNTFNKYEILNELDNDINSTGNFFANLKSFRMNNGNDECLTPDVYYLSVPGYSGKFVIDGNNAYFLKKENNIKIEFWNSFNDKHGALSLYPYFKITTPEGIIHYFGAKTSSHYLTSGKMASCQFLLMETEYPNGQRIYYEYGTTSSTKLLFNEMLCVSVHELNGFPQENGDDIPKDGQASYYNSNDWSRSSIIVEDSYLKKITTTNYVINFSNKPREDVLNGVKIDNITIQSNATSKIKTFGFFTSYFDCEVKTGCENNHYDQGRLNKRLRLDSIAEISGTLQQNTYRFKYNDTKLPPKDSYAVDYWGLYNGKQDNQTFLPNLRNLLGSKSDGQSIVLSSYTSKFSSDIVPAFFIANSRTQFACRAYDFNYARASMLETIIYPTGGQMHYIFEPNTYISNSFVPDVAHLADLNATSFPLSFENIGCGIRIKSIVFKETDNSPNLITSNFNYSGGILHSRIAFHDANNSIVGLSKIALATTVFGEKKNYHFCYFFNLKDDIDITSENTCSNPYEYTNGVGYKSVVETKYGVNSNNISITNEFHNEKDIDNTGGNYAHNDWYNIASSSNFSISDPLNGMPTKIENSAKSEKFTYDTNQQKFLWGVRVVDNLNRFSGMYSYPSPAFPWTPCEDCLEGFMDQISIALKFQFGIYPTTTGPRFTLTKFQIPCYSVLLKEKITSKDNIQTYEDYTYNPNTLQLTTQSLSDENGRADNTDTYTGNLMIKKYSYPNDYDCEPFKTMAQKNMLNKVVEEKTYRNYKLVSGIYTDYINTGNNNYMPHNRYYSTISSPITTDPVTSSCSGPGNLIYPLQPNVVFDTYDTWGNPQYIVENNATKVVYLWSYNYQYPVAEIKNATYTQVTSALSTLGTNPSEIASATAPDMVKVNGLRAALPAAQITTYTYQPLTGMTSKTDPRGVTIRYIYDSFGRLGVVKDNNSNTLGLYRYAYRNGTEASITGSGVSPMTVSINAPTATYSNNPISATATVTGGSGNFTYSWYLKDGVGSLVQSAVNASSSQFDFTFPTSDVYTLQCDVTDYLTGEVVSNTESITCYDPLVVNPLVDESSYNHVYNVSAYISGGSGYQNFLWKLYPSDNPNNILTSLNQNMWVSDGNAWFFHDGWFVSTTSQTLELQVTDINTDQTIIVTKVMKQQ